MTISEHFLIHEKWGVDLLVVILLISWSDLFATFQAGEEISEQQSC